MTEPDKRAFLFDRPIAFQRPFVTITGSVTAALFLSQAVYWARRTEHEGGWFFKSQADWQEETGMRRREQDGARKRLKDLGLIHEERRGFNPVVWYRVDFDRLMTLLAAADGEPERVEDEPDEPPDDPENEVTRTTPDVQNVQQLMYKTYNALNETETTAETTLAPSAGGHGGPPLRARASAEKKQKYAVPRTVIKIVTDKYQNQYVEDFGVKPPWGNAEIEAIKRHIGRLTGNDPDCAVQAEAAETLAAAIREAFRSRDAFLRRQRTSFKSLMADAVIDQLIAEVRANSRADPDDAENVMAAQNAAYGTRRIEEAK